MMISKNKNSQFEISKTEVHNLLFEINAFMIDHNKLIYFQEMKKISFKLTLILIYIYILKFCYLK